MHIVGHSPMLAMLAYTYSINTLSHPSDRSIVQSNNHQSSTEQMNSLSDRLIAGVRAREPVAILYQVTQPPPIDGLVRPLKPGGYSDSSADIAFALRVAGVHVITPVNKPDPSRVSDWCWPDTDQSLSELVRDHDVRCIWSNTVLWTEHPITRCPSALYSVGQSPAQTAEYDNKFVTNSILSHNDIPIPTCLLTSNDAINTQHHGFSVYPLTSIDSNFLSSHSLSFPVMVKPVRGRGSQGVKLVRDITELHCHANLLLSQPNDYGHLVMIEEYLSGQEITVTVMPPGQYEQPINASSNYFALPAVIRDQHDNGVLPYNGVVAVTANSRAVTNEEAQSISMKTVVDYCVRAADILRVLSVIRIDCRADAQGNFKLFDLNMKPNFTGCGRPGRQDADSLVAIAANKSGWSFDKLCLQLLANSHTIDELNNVDITHVRQHET